MKVLQVRFNIQYVTFSCNVKNQFFHCTENIEFRVDKAASKRCCREWFQQLSNGDYDVKDKECPGVPRKFKDKELNTSSDENSPQTLKELSQ